MVPWRNCVPLSSWGFVGLCAAAVFYTLSPSGMKSGCFSDRLTRLKTNMEVRKLQFTDICFWKSLWLCWQQHLPGVTELGCAKIAGQVRELRNTCLVLTWRADLCLSFSGNDTGAIEVVDCRQISFSVAEKLEVWPDLLLEMIRISILRSPNSIPHSFRGLGLRYCKWLICFDVDGAGPFTSWAFGPNTGSQPWSHWVYLVLEVRLQDDSWFITSCLPKWAQVYLLPLLVWDLHYSVFCPFLSYVLFFPHFGSYTWSFDSFLWTNHNISYK